MWNYDSDGNYIKNENKYQNPAQRFSEALELGASKLIKKIFDLLGVEKWGKASMNCKGPTILRESEWTELESCGRVFISSVHAVHSAIG